MVRNIPASAGNLRDASSIPGSGRSGGGHGNSLKYSCLENPMDGGAWWAAVHGVAKSWTRLKRLSSSSSSMLHELHISGCSHFCQPWAAKYICRSIGETGAGDMGYFFNCFYIVYKVIK